MVVAARRALDAAGVNPGDVDGLIAVSMFPDRVGSGDAGYRPDTGAVHNVLNCALRPNGVDEPPFVARVGSQCTILE